MVEGLKHNLLIISQLCNKDNNVTFGFSGSRIVKYKSNDTFILRSRSGNTYTVNLNKIHSNDVCLMSNEDESWLWHMRIAHIYMDHLNKVFLKDLVVGLPNLHFKKKILCDVCQKGKQVRAYFKEKNIVSTN